VLWGFALQGRLEGRRAAGKAGTDAAISVVVHIECVVEGLDGFAFEKGRDDKMDRKMVMKVYCPFSFFSFHDNFIRPHGAPREHALAQSFLSCTCSI
jgi:hypothetical protein